MEMTSKENFDWSSSGSGSSTGDRNERDSTGDSSGDDYGDRNESFWQSKCRSFVHEINE